MDKIKITIGKDKYDVDCDTTLKELADKYYDGNVPVVCANVDNELCSLDKTVDKDSEVKFLTYYIADYLNEKGHVKSYEFISRDNHLTEETFGQNKPAGVGMVSLSVDGNKVLLQKEFR